MKLEAITIQSQHIKQFFSSLKEQITDTDLECGPDGIRIRSVDATHVVCIHAELYATSFEHFKCEIPFTIGIDVMSVNKILKHIVNGDVLTLFVETDEFNGDVFGIKIKNDSKAEDCTVYIDPIDTNVISFNPDDLNYSVSISIPSSDLQSIIGKLKNTGSEVLQLIYKNQTLTFIAKGDVGRMTINRRKPDTSSANGITIQKDECESLITVFLNINKVFEFTKCTNLSQFVTFFMQTDCPVFFEYQIGSLGRIRLGLSQRNIPENW